MNHFVVLRTYTQIILLKSMKRLVIKKSILEIFSFAVRPGTRGSVNKINYALGEFHEFRELA